MPHLFLSAGDTSGDQHAARLLTALRERLPGLTAEGLGGPRLEAAGMTLHHDLVQKAVFGIAAAARVVPEMLGLLRRMAGVLDARRPDAVVLVDYPGFNLFMARVAHARRIPVIYFVAPQLWAWAPWRARRFARVVDQALTIFPFEVDFFREAGLPAEHVGHPLLDALPVDGVERPELAARPRPVALLPGSRRREVGDHMPPLLDAARRLLTTHPDVSFHTAHVAPEQLARMESMADEAGIGLVTHGDDVHGVMASCRCALVASGTATLETALLGTPLVVFYRMSPVEHLLARVLVLPPWFGQVNLMSGTALTPEVVLTDDDGAALAEALRPLLDDTEARAAQRQGLAALRAALPRGGAVARAADLLAARLDPSRPLAASPEAS